MTDSPAQARIEAAIARIETAVAARRHDAAGLAQRHAALKSQVGEAIASLDAVLAQRGGE